MGYTNVIPAKAVIRDIPAIFPTTPILIRRLFRSSLNLILSQKQRVWVWIHWEIRNTEAYDPGLKPWALVERCRRKMP